MASASGPILMEIIIEVNLKLALKEAVVYTLLKMVKNTKVILKEIKNMV